MSKFEIRRYQPADHDAVWQLHNLVLHHAGAHAGNGLWDDDLHAVEAVYLDGGEFLVGLLDGQIVAMGAFRQNSETCAEIKRMRVHPDCQRRGCGQAILTRLEARAAELGYTRLILDTTTVQVGAQRFYEKNGYRQFGRTTWGPFEVLLYCKDL